MQRRPSVLEDSDQVMADQVIDARRSRPSQQAEAAGRDDGVERFPRRERARLQAAARNEHVRQKGQLPLPGEADVRALLAEVLKERSEAGRFMLPGIAASEQRAPLRLEALRGEHTSELVKPFGNDRIERRFWHRRTQAVKRCACAEQAWSALDRTGCIHAPKVRDGNRVLVAPDRSALARQRQEGPRIGGGREATLRTSFLAIHRHVVELLRGLLKEIVEAIQLVPAVGQAPTAAHHRVKALSVPG